MSKNYQLSFYLKGGKVLYRKANQRDVTVITSEWSIEPGNRFLAINFEHQESPPIIINLDVLEYIDFRVI